MYFFDFCKGSFTAHALGQSWLIVLLLPSTLLFTLLNSYTIDPSCFNYNGIDISADIRQAVKEVESLCIQAYVKIWQKDPDTIHLLNILFDTDPSMYDIISQRFAAFASKPLNDEDIVVICGDSMVHLLNDISLPDVHPDPNGLWVDYEHSWWSHYGSYIPCEAARRPGTRGVRGFTMRSKLIYLCPQTLDHPRGRSLEPYKDQILADEFIDDYNYILLPIILLHELLHTHFTRRKFLIRLLHYIAR